jgi:hypothetical protein
MDRSRFDDLFFINGVSNSVSSRSVFARRCSHDTATLEAWMTWASMPRALSHRASQKPSRPASKATAMRLILCPAFSASSRHRSSNFSNALVDPELFQRLAFDARHDTGNEPARKAHLDDGDQCCILFESYEGSAQIVPLWHGALH